MDSPWGRLGRGLRSEKPPALRFPSRRHSMRSEPFRVQRLDHVHVLVTDRPAAIAWYARVFGLEKVYDDMAHGDTRGPITLSSDDGATHLALFERDKIPPSQTVAFRVDGAGFMRFLDRLAE